MINASSKKLMFFTQLSSLYMWSGLFSASFRLYFRLNYCKNDCRKANFKVITASNHKGSKQHTEPIRIPSLQLAITWSKGGKIHTYKMRLVLVLLLIDWRGTFRPSYLAQSRVITFDSHLNFTFILQQELPAQRQFWT